VTSLTFVARALCVDLIVDFVSMTRGLKLSENVVIHVPIGLTRLVEGSCNTSPLIISAWDVSKC
jgi:hypothetical protein